MQRGSVFVVVVVPEEVQVPLADRLQRCYSGAVYDVMRERNQSKCLLPRDIRPLDPTVTLAGPVFTVQGRPQEGLSAHDSLLRWTEFLSVAPVGSVVVCQPNDDVRALMGELSAETLKFRGIRGYIVDGGSRDNDFILNIGFRVFCRFFTPRDVVGEWAATAFGEPISMGGLTIRTGDYVLGDRDGIVVIPEAIVEDVVSEVEAVIATENLVRKAILEGVDPKTAYLRHGKF